MTTFTPEEQRQNLRKLGEYLLTGKTRMRFNMLILCYNETNRGLKPDQHECGTVGCALGHGPDATGINGLKDETWDEYSLRVFGLNDLFYNTADTANALGWCFAGGWLHIDNTPEGAGKRILYYLEHGVPKDWIAQMLGKVPLCY